MKKVILFWGLFLGISMGWVKAQTRVEYKLPDISGYYTLKGDFHIHTFYSDGSVSPEDRVKEAWRDGLDVIAITDHIEYPNSQLQPFDLNKSYDLAIKTAQEYGIILIKGGEITRSMPPGHFNALFLSDVNKLRLENVDDAYNEVVKQNGFLIWNHPGWDAQITDSLKWYPKHTELYSQNRLNGIEIFNEKVYYPQVFQWALDISITIFANSDIHAPINFLYDPSKNEKRAMTLVLAKEKTTEGIREALINHRTIAIFDHKMYGQEQFVKPMIEKCIVVGENITMPHNSNEAYISLTNISDFPIYLKGIKNSQFQLPENVELLPNTTVRVKVSKIKTITKGINNLKLPFMVENGFIGPDKQSTIEIGVNLMVWGVVKLEKKSPTQWKISSESLAPNLTYWYSIDETKPGFTTLLPFQQADSIHFTMTAFQNNIQVGEMYEADYFLHAAMNQKIELKNPPHQKYNGQGNETLIDGIKGSNSYSDGKWLGFSGEDLEATIIFDTKTNLQNITLVCFEANKAWIFLPTEITIYVSNDGINFKKVHQQEIKISSSESNSGINTIQINKNLKGITHLKIIVKNRKTCPEWHASAGKPSWLFVSEIICK